jgi:VanZ family protein
MACIMGMIFFLSHQPYDILQLPPLIGPDKLLHVIAYSILAASFLYALLPFIDHSSRIVAGVVVVLFCLLYGISDEYHQSFIPGRFPSVWDVLADVSGAVLVVIWWWKKEEGKEKS